MMIVQIAWWEPENDIRLFPEALAGIIERSSRPSAEFVYLDTEEQVLDLKARIAKHVPKGREPHIQTIFAGTGRARDVWAAMICSEVTGAPVSTYLPNR